MQWIPAYAGMTKAGYLRVGLIITDGQPAGSSSRKLKMIGTNTELAMG